MDADTITAHGIPNKPRHDTTRSWRVIKNVLIWSLSALAALIGFVVTFNDTSMGDSDARITDFESSLRDYIRAATQARHAKLCGVDFSRTYEGIPFQTDLVEEAPHLVQAVKHLVYANQDHAWATINQTVAEYNFAHSGDKADLLVHSDAALRALRREWVKRDTLNIVLKASGIAAISGIVTWVIAWILVVGSALIWWFMMDRIRDLSRAIKGQ